MTHFVHLQSLKLLLNKAKMLTIRELSRKTPDSIGAKLLIASTGMRAYGDHGNLLKTASIHRPLSVLISKDFPKSLRILIVKLLRNVRLRSRISFGRRQKKTLV